MVLVVWIWGAIMSAASTRYGLSVLRILRYLLFGVSFFVPLLFGGLVVAQEACEALPAPVVNIVSASIYGDGKDGLKSSVDRVSSLERERLVAPISNYMRIIASDADAYLDRGSSSHAACAVGGLREWARAGALLGSTNNEAANKEIIWNSAGLALAYLRVKPVASPAEAAEIELWLGRLAGRVMGLYSRSARHDNILCWVALVAVSTAAATGDQDLWNTGTRLHEIALREVDADGALPLELERGRRALAYHNFALVPLLAADVIRRRYSHPTSPSSVAALNRLASFVQANSVDPSTISRLAGAEQDPLERRNYDYWSYMAAGAIPGFGLPKQVGRPPFDRWLGGNAQYFTKRMGVQ